MTSKNPTVAADKILDEAKGKFPLVLVIGLNDEGQVDIASNQNQYPVLQWLLSKTQFELNIHEKNSNNVAKAEATVEAAVKAETVPDVHGVNTI